MSHLQFHRIKLFILRHAWLNLWDKHMTTGRINQVTIVRLCFFSYGSSPFSSATRLPPPPPPTPWNIVAWETHTPTPHTAGERERAREGNRILRRDTLTQTNKKATFKEQQRAFLPARKPLFLCVFHGLKGEDIYFFIFHSPPKRQGVLHNKSLGFQRKYIVEVCSIEKCFKEILVSTEQLLRSSVKRLWFSSSLFFRWLPCAFPGWRHRKSCTESSWCVNYHVLFDKREQLSFCTFGPASFSKRHPWCKLCPTHYVTQLVSLHHRTVFKGLGWSGLARLSGTQTCKSVQRLWLHHRVWIQTIASSFSVHKHRVNSGWSESSFGDLRLCRSDHESPLLEFDLSQQLPCPRPTTIGSTPWANYLNWTFFHF
jgi:hypothetical protein